MPFETDVFVNCPFDHDYAPLLEAMLFCLVHSGMNPRLATERLENDENRLEKIYGLACGAKYSVHDLSRCQAAAAGDYARINMPFEIGMDLGIRRAAELEKKLSEGHAEKAALRLPTSERLAEMRDWVAMGKPDSFGRR